MIDPNIHPNFVFLHGFLGNRHFWEPIENSIQTALPTSTTQSLDLPGHNESSFFSQHQSEAPSFADATNWIATHSSPAPPSWLVGYSMGARLSLSALLTHSKQYSGAVLFSVHPGITTEAERRQRTIWEQYLIELLNENPARSQATGNPMAPLVEYFEKLPLFDTQKQLPKDIMAAQRIARLNHQPRQVSKAVSLIGLGNTPPMDVALHANTKPILIVTGSLDEKYTRIGSMLSEKHSSIQHTSVENVGHNVVLESPNTSAQCILDFVAANAFRGA